MAANPRQFVLGGVAVILAGAAAWSYFTRSSAVPRPSETITVDGVCLACQEDVIAHYHVSEGQPAACPLCGERRVYGAFYCQQCNLRVVPNLQATGEGQPPKIPMIPTCPVCGGSVIGYIKEDPEHAQAQRGPLPDWPP